MFATLPFDLCEMVQAALGRQPMTTTKLNLRLVCHGLSDRKGTTYQHILRDVWFQSICRKAYNDPTHFFCLITEQLIATRTASDIQGRYGCVVPVQILARVHRAVYDVLLCTGRRGFGGIEGSIQIYTILETSVAPLLQSAALDNAGVEWVVHHLDMLLRHVDQFIAKDPGEERLVPYRKGVRGAIQRGLLCAAAAPESSCGVV